MTEMAIYYSFLSWSRWFLCNNLSCLLFPLFLSYRIDVFYKNSPCQEIP